MTSNARLLFSLLFLNTALAALPNVDFDRMGKVGLGGAFAGLGLFDSNSSPIDPATATLLQRDHLGGLSRLASTNSGGSILAGCALKNLYYFGGSFTAIGSTSANNVASYSPSSGAFAALGSGGPNGQVNAIYCDEKDNKIWVGGQFTSPGPSVAVWDVKASSWSKAPFGGLAGPVNSITTNSSQSSLIFTGSFITSFGNSSAIPVGASNPNLPPSAGATPFSSSLVPIPLQSAEISGLSSSPDSQFSNVQTILCPAGPDGPGNTWLAGASNTAVLTARTFSFMSANGIRLGNTFQSGHGTRGFSVTTIPDNTVQRMHYFDPVTRQNQTCTDPCPLLSDPSIPYQDFLFDSPLSITGVQVKLSEFTGSGPGLHLFQVLSSGAFAAALDKQNIQSCFAPNPSNTTRTGTWVEKLANTNIPGTTQEVLVSNVGVGTPESQAPVFTWIPYVSASGDYDINLLVPGCTNFQDCEQRTSVKVTVFPGNGMAPWVSTISQQNTADTVSLIYSGPVVPSSPDFVTTVSMTLADQPVGNGQGGKYGIVADRVQLVLKSANPSASPPPSGGGGGGNVGPQGANNGFGFFEWPRNSAGANIDATKNMANSSQSFLDEIGFSLFRGIGGRTSATSSTVRAVAHHPSGVIFIGGQFQLSTGAANIAVFRNGVLSALQGNGLNGPVSSFALDGDNLFVGGAFKDTASGSTQGMLSGVAMYNIKQNQWEALQAGVDGPVSNLDFSGGRVQLAGNFTKLLTSAGDGLDAAGLATWDRDTKSWVNSGGYMVGKLSMISRGTSAKSADQQTQFIAGSVAASLKYGGSGFIMLQNGKNGPSLSPLGVPLGHDVAASSSSASVKSRRHSTEGAAAWIPEISELFSRQSSSQVASLPSSLPAPAPAVLAGSFWTNMSTAQEVVIVGGNFSFSYGSIKAQGVGIYDPKTSKLTALQGPQVNGVVRTLLVMNDLLYVGGQFTLEGTNVNGLATYDLTKQQWANLNVPPLSRASGSPVVVRSITASSSKPNAVIVAGSFTQAGSLSCPSICSLDNGSKQWGSLGNGLKGEVTNVAYAGANQEVLVASGSVALSDNTGATNVVKFTFSNGSWSSLGTGSDLPGPVTALEVNSGNASSIFAAGKSNDGSSSFVSFWDGLSWRNLVSTLQASSSVAQLIMVPLQDTHSTTGVIEPDRMLMVSGSLTDSSFGTASSALFDGRNFIPYITSASPSGSPGSVATLFHSFSKFSFSHRRFLATGVVILISIAIGAGIVFLLALVGILWTLFSRRDEGLGPAEPEEETDSMHHRPSSLLENINAATRTTIFGAQGPYAKDEKEYEGVAASNNDQFGPDTSDFARAETPSEALAGTLTGDGEVSRPAHARYSFDGGGEGELPLKAGQEIEVLDDRDPAWWYARDPRSGREGVVPAAYLY